MISFLSQIIRQNHKFDLGMEISENKKVKGNKYIVGSNIVFEKTAENVKFILLE